MRPSERDNDQLGVIAHYCGRLNKNRDYFGGTFEAFLRTTAFQDSCALCLIQIGEATARLTDGFKSRHPEIDWKRIYGMRCHLVHGYEMFDAEIAWDAMKCFVPPLEDFCKTHFRT